MIRIPEDGILYHGSYTEVAQIDLSLCRYGLDFGKGFYLTFSPEQAASYIPASVRKAKRRGIIADSFKEADGKYPYSNSTRTPTFSSTVLLKPMKNGFTSQRATEAGIYSLSSGKSMPS